jgi:hypothetical protein
MISLENSSKEKKELPISYNSTPQEFDFDFQRLNQAGIEFKVIMDNFTENIRNNSISHITLGILRIKALKIILAEKK